MDAIDDCGCCEGPNPLPKGRDNPVGAPAIAYRVGTHASFKAALLSQLSSAANPALAPLRTRSDDDFAIATCDATAVLLDVLAFYQERYANELYLRTATERRSVLELARLIGYQLAPGVAASVRLAFQLQDAPGAPSQGPEPVRIPVGTRVQSVPGPDEEPQTFETVEEVTARLEWNGMPVRASQRQALGVGAREAYVAGVATQLQVGDRVLIVGDERKGNQVSTMWKTRELIHVEPDAEKGWTRIEWAVPLDVGGAEKNVRLYVFRLRTALFGHNAMDPRMLRLAVVLDPTNLIQGALTDRKWVGYGITSEQVDLDGPFPKVQPDTWFLLLQEDGTQALGLIDTVKHRSRAAYGLSGKITRLKQKTGSASVAAFKLEETVVFAQSEELPLVQRPLPYPLFGTTLAVSVRSEALLPRQVVAVTGRRPRLEIRVQDAALVFHTDAGEDVATSPGDSFVLAGAPLKLSGAVEVSILPEDLATFQADQSTVVRWRLADRDGREGTLDATFTQVKLQPSLKDDPEVSELATLSEDLATAAVPDRDGTAMQLASPLAHMYDRATARVCANLALATHGESVGEVAGSGKADTPNQAFALRQKPLTFVSASTPSGRESTLTVRVDGLAWTEVESLFDRGPRERVYALSRDDDHVTTVRFGDGVEGARLPSGQDNVRFTYRKYLGSAGNLAAGRLTTLLGRPLGVKSASNPAPATGGQDPEALEDARGNAPLGMLTLGRAVSLQDYADLARTFAGVARAQAVWVGTGLTRGIFVTVAGVDGAAIEAGTETMKNLVDALRKYGDPLVRLHVATYAAPTFTLTGRIKVAADAVAEEVMPQVEAALRAHYAFGRRDFGQTVSIDEVMAVIHGVKGVEAADIDTLQRVEPGAVSLPRLFAWPARVAGDGTLLPAELLTLDAGVLDLEVMP